MELESWLKIYSHMAMRMLRKRTQQISVLRRTDGSFFISQGYQLPLLHSRLGLKRKEKVVNCTVTIECSKPFMAVHDQSFSNT